MRFNLYYFYWSALLFIIELYIAIFVKDNFVRPYMGDFLVVILIYAFIRAFFKYSMVTTATGVLLFSFIVEVLQYFKIVEVLGLDSSELARTVIGTTFVWKDLVAYSLGIAMVLLCEHFIGPKIKQLG
ncbi:MAG: DUF2809 domain-containing protein [Cyanobacteria bacterium P01_F01_bin.13]